MITRRKDYSKRQPSKNAGKIYIICEGKGTEPDYFSFFEGLSSNLEFEVWLYYHHYAETPDREDVAGHPSVKAFVNMQIAGGFDFQRDQVRLQNAIENSENNYHRKDNGNPAWFSTEQFMLGQEIENFVKTEIQKLRNKMG